MTATNGNSDALAVYVRDFVPHLEAYLSDNDSGVDDEFSHVFGGGKGMAGPVDVLSEESEVDQRRIYAFRNFEQKYLTFRVFDQLITAMGMPNLAWEIPVYRNPMWSVPRFMRWLDEQGMTAEELGVSIEQSQPVPWIEVSS